MRVLITGAGGMLAHSLGPELRGQGMEVEALDREGLDVEDRQAIEKVLDRVNPDAVVQCAAYTGVDSAEDEPERAYRLNAEAAGHMVDACQRRGALFVYPSSDYVFDGESAEPYDPDDDVAPLNVYGASKAAGEKEARRANRHLIVRTSWLYGSGGRNFVKTISRIAAERGVIKVVDDQVGLPTWTGSLSYIIARLLKVGAIGTFHAADAGAPICWYDFAREILEFQGIEAVVTPVSSDEFGARARRPRFSILDCAKTERMLGEKLPTRDASLTEYLSCMTLN